ncbi:hypothetical protein, partial [Roseibium sp.]|uniref:hypothetical protein n=1 Tax=Roseibium sp. TaxID=1936156 RepID=UPI003919151F
ARSTDAQQLRFADLPSDVPQTETAPSGSNPFVSSAHQLIESNGDSTLQSDSDSVFVSEVDDDYSAASNLLGLSNADREAGHHR